VRLDAYGVTAAVLKPSQSESLIHRMQLDPRWTLAYHDDEGYLFVRAR
jgi:hypothetical protein